MIDFAHRMENLSPHFFASLSAKIASLQAEGCDVIRLDEGSPDLPPAPAVIETLARSAALPGHHRYQTHRGPQAYRLAWAEMYRREFDVEIDPMDEIVPLLGSKEGIFHMGLALVQPGDIVLIPDPGYITYTRSAKFAGGEPYYVPLHPQYGYLPDLQSVPPEIARRAKLIWLNYPNNPTGATATLEFFSRVIDFAREYHLLVCHDAAYTQITFDGANAPSILQVPGAKEFAVEFNTLSKSHNMAGWRVGAALGNSQALSALFTLKTNADSSHFLPILEAATAAITGDQGWLRERNEIYRQRRDVVISGLHAIGLSAPALGASLYVWSPIPAGSSSVAFAVAALENAHVSLTPGTVFGDHGEGFVRISLTAPSERIAEAMQRLASWMKT